MVQLSRTMTVRPPLPTVVDYLKDFANAESWDPGTVSCVRIGDAPVGVGTEWRNVSLFRGKETTLIFRLEHVGDDRLVFVGRNKTATSTDTVTFAALDNGSTSVTYMSHVVFHGIAKLADLFMRKEFDRLGDELVVKLPAAVDRLASPPGSVQD